MFGSAIFSDISHLRTSRRRKGDRKRKNKINSCFVRKAIGVSMKEKLPSRCSVWEGKLSKVFIAPLNIDLLTLRWKEHLSTIGYEFRKCVGLACIDAIRKARSSMSFREFLALPFKGWRFSDVVEENTWPGISLEMRLKTKVAQRMPSRKTNI